jgi:hypothetical protein
VVSFENFKCRSNLLFCALGFLQAKDVRVHHLDILNKIFLNDGSNTVYVPVDEMHASSLRFKV